jgi:hypothetical protein
MLQQALTMDVGKTSEESLLVAERAHREDKQLLHVMIVYITPIAADVDCQ